MATYLVLIYGREQAWDEMSHTARKQLIDGHQDLARVAGDAVLDTRELEPASAATTLRADSAGGLAVVDEPFREDPEQIGGYHLLEAADLDEVIGLVGRLYEATADHGGIEVRRVGE